MSAFGDSGWSQYQVCAIRTDGTLLCWGEWWYEHPTPPPPAGTFTAVSVGDGETCAIRTNGRLACWSNDPKEWPSLTPPAGTFGAVSVGGSHRCAIRTDEILVCWGWDGDGSVVPRPGAELSSLPRWLAAARVPLAWSGQPAFAAVVSYDVRYKRVKWNARSYGPWVRWKSATRSTSATFRAAPGYTYCFEVRARDAEGHVGHWEPRYDVSSSCPAIPLDDRALARSAGWVARTGTPFYRDTYLRSSSRGATLRVAGVVGRRIALLATTCPACGTVKVFWNSTLIATINLASAVRTDRV